MTEQTIDETLEKWEKKTDEVAKELKLPNVFTVCGCKGTVVTTALFGSLRGQGLPIVKRFGQSTW
ncbi:unnamed protein product [marine sediment metagenome]|uniref:Uncharacterized protein n=1 Tax=marine sediment metagenome TaxID=412755 RepID=X1KRY6_9ZZZZ